MTPTEWIAKNL